MRATPIPQRPLDQIEVQVRWRWVGAVLLIIALMAFGLALVRCYGRYQPRLREALLERERSEAQCIAGGGRLAFTLRNVPLKACADR